MPFKWTHFVFHNNWTLLCARRRTLQYRDLLTFLLIRVCIKHYAYKEKGRDAYSFSRYEMKRIAIF